MVYTVCNSQGLYLPTATEDVPEGDEDHDPNVPTQDMITHVDTAGEDEDEDMILTADHMLTEGEGGRGWEGAGEHTPDI